MQEAIKEAKPLFNLKTYTSLNRILGEQTGSTDGIHVFGTSEITRNVRKRYQLKALSMDEVIDQLFRGYRTGLTEIYFQSEIRKLIQTGNYQHETYLLNRIPSIMNTVYAMADLGRKAIQFQGQSERQSEIIALVNALLKDDIIEHFHYQKQTLTRNEIAKLLCGDSTIHKIAFYQIEYLNFGRMNLVHWLQAKGFEVEFCIPYNASFPQVYQFWKSVYQVVTRQDIDEIAHSKEMPSFGHRFAAFNENILMDHADRKDVMVMEFESPRDFADFYQTTNDKITAVHPDDINRIVSNVIAEPFENGYGKFIYYLQFCQKQDDTIFVSYDHLMELITSEWVSTRAVSGKDALALLKDLEEYMSGVESIQDVKTRLQQLSDLDIVSKTFDQENMQDAGKSRMKRYLLNPFRAFAFLQQGRYQVTINQLIELVEQTEKLCQYLVMNEGETMPVNDYLQRWNSIMDRYEDSWEKDVYTFWKKVFTPQHPAEWVFPIQELLSVIYLTVSNYMDNTNTTIYSMPTLQASIMEEEEAKTLHITNLTLMNFPESYHATITDFFSHQELKQLITESLGSSWSTNRLLHALWVDYTVGEYFDKLGTYQMYHVISSYQGPIRFSWIKHLQADDFRNIYLDIIADLYQQGEIISYQVEESVEQEKEGTIPSSELTQASAVQELKGKIPALFWLDHDFCAKKFFLTTLIEQQPVYEDVFHQQFLFSKIGKLFSISADERAEFRSLIYPLFPHWTYSKKENLIDTEYPAQLRIYKEFENVTYPKEMNRIQLLRSVYQENRRTKARNRYRKNTAFKDADVLKQFQENVSRYKVKAEPGNHCKMCPHLQNCSEGMYAIDNISQE
ncbi:hypothetical protein [Oceanobacillus halotolerans]|uniref:hypothetical protein n=1 Tax=Oceanobacillus halotolerans TaxID=2663380 RepID=UPI0013DA351F|nr:hypothetical protein [Oceanobacillus halotolerans]